MHVILPIAAGYITRVCSISTNGASKASAKAEQTKSTVYFQISMREGGYYSLFNGCYCIVKLDDCSHFLTLKS